MRIAVNVDGQYGPEPSGIHRYVDSLLGALAEQADGHELIAFAPALHPGHHMPALDPRIGLDVPGAPLVRRRIMGAAGRVHPGLPWRLEGLALRARTRAASRRFDVLHVPSAHCRFYEDCRARSLVATIYDLTPRLHPETQPPGWVTEWIRYFAFARERCARVLTISEAARHDIVEHLGIPPGRIDVTPLAPRAGTRHMDDGVARDRLLAPWGLAGRPFVLYAGAVEPRKNLSTLVKAFALAARDLGDERLALVLAGGAWGDHGRVLAAAAEHDRIADRLVMTGYVPDDVMNALMSACRAFAYVSRYEGFGLPPLEAMACGAPVVTSNVSSLPEVVGDAALQVPPFDVSALAGALRRLLGDERERERRRAASRERAARFSWHRTAALTLRCYEVAAC